jgi:antitoxin (DNA-binding transcriptional repressor) of toxin-antitoxin stability system
MNSDALALAKERLRIPELWRLLNLPGEAAKSCRSPLRADDANPSFSVFDDGLRWKDHGTGEHGDAVDFLARARSLSLKDAIAEFKRLAGVADAAPAAPSRSNLSPRIVATYDYRDEAGQLLFQVVRLEPKSFRQRRPDVSAPDGWTWKLGDTRRVLYRLPEVLAAIAAGETIFVVEGEKDVAALIAHGFAATCNPGGAGKWLDDYTATLRGADVVLVADKDEAGRRHVERAAGKLHSTAKTLRTVELPEFNGRPVKDAADYFAAGATAEDFRAVVTQAALFLPPAAPQDVSYAAFSALPEKDASDAAPAPFPTNCLPPALALMVRATADALRVPDALPGTMALALVAASIGKGLTLDWRPGKTPTPANLFVMPSAESGSGKSECYKLLATPFLAFERAMQEQWRKEVMPQHQADLRYAEGQLKRLDKTLARATDPQEIDRSRGQMQFHLARIEELKRLLHEPQLSIQDATVEKAASVMHGNDETIFSTSSDARKLVDNILGRYSSNKLADDGIYLCAFSGDVVKVDRQGREGVRLENPCLTLLWALQPDALDLLLGEDSLQKGGFLARCLLAHTHAEPQPIDGAEGGVPDSTRARWEMLLRDLLVAYRQPVTLPASETDL